MRQSWVVAGLWSLLEGCPHTQMASPPGKWSVVFFHTPVMGFFEHKCMATLETLRSGRLFLPEEQVLELVRRPSSEGCRDNLCLGCEPSLQWLSHLPAPQFVSWKGRAGLDILESVLPGA